jgi:imidazolonepropionase-like amidohydrolase
MFAVRAGQLIDGTGDAPIREAVLLVDGEYILEVGSARSVAIPSDCSVIDAFDLTLMPGMIDAHVHITHNGDPDDNWQIRYLRDSTGLLALKGYANAHKDLLAGFTTVRDLGARSYSNVAVRDAIDAGLVTGPRIVACGLPICSTGGHIDMQLAEGNVITGHAAVIDSPDEARAAVRQQFKMGADCIKIAVDGRVGERYDPRSTLWQELSDAELKAICDTTHEAGRRVAAHTSGGPGMCSAIRAGIDSLEHLQGFTEEEMDLIAQHKVILVPTLTATRCTVDTGDRPDAPERFRERAIELSRQNWRDKQLGMKRALAAGVKMALGTDAGFVNCFHGNNAYELELLVEEGMTSMQAIMAATSMAAECLQFADHIGTLAKDYYADFLLVQGDPLSDISVLRDQKKLRAICKGGEFIKKELSDTLTAN